MGNNPMAGHASVPELFHLHGHIHTLCHVCGDPRGDIDGILRRHKHRGTM